MYNKKQNQHAQNNGGRKFVWILNFKENNNKKTTTHIKVILWKF